MGEGNVRFGQGLSQNMVLVFCIQQSLESQIYKYYFVTSAMNKKVT